MIKKIKIPFILMTLIVLISCQSITQHKVFLEIPIPAKIDISNYDKIIFTSFKIKSNLKDIDFNKEIFDFFSPEIKKDFKGEIIFKDINWQDENLIENKNYWKNFSKEKEKSLVFTGNLSFKKELRKALLEEKSFYSAGEERKLASRLFYIIEFNLYLIDTRSGECVYQKNFKESKGYKILKQKPSYALFELFEKIKNTLFNEIISHKKREERYLIY